MARFDRLTVYQTLLAEGLVPLFYQADVHLAQQTLTALYQGGCHVLEFTNRGEAALEVFSALLVYARQHCPDFILGVGSIEDAPTAALFIAQGANFVVGPTFQEDIARLCNRRKIPYLPGCGTVNEIARAEEWGVEIVKAFPAEAVGGPSFIKAVREPRPWTRIMPTGGVTPDEANLRTWFEAGAACVGMGGRLIRPQWLAEGNFAAIQTLTAETLATIRLVRGQK